MELQKTPNSQSNLKKTTAKLEAPLHLQCKRNNYHSKLFLCTLSCKQFREGKFIFKIATGSLGVDKHALLNFMLQSEGLRNIKNAKIWKQSSGNASTPSECGQCYCIYIKSHSSKMRHCVLLSCIVNAFPVLWRLCFLRKKKSS